MKFLPLVILSLVLTACMPYDPWTMEGVAQGNQQATLIAAELERQKATNVAVVLGSQSTATFDAQQAQRRAEEMAVQSTLTAQQMEREAEQRNLESLAAQATADAMLRQADIDRFNADLVKQQSALINTNEISTIQAEHDAELKRIELLARIAGAATWAFSALLVLGVILSAYGYYQFIQTRKNAAHRIEFTTFEGGLYLTSGTEVKRLQDPARDSYERLRAVVNNANGSGAIDKVTMISPSVAESPIHRLTSQRTEEEQWRRDVMSYLIKAAYAAEDRWLSEKIPHYSKIDNNSEKWKEYTDSLVEAGLVTKSGAGTLAKEPYKNMHEIFQAINEQNVRLPLPRKDGIRELGD